MDDKDFDKLFSDKMRVATTPDFSDEDWQPLSQRLDGWQRRRWGILPLWWLGALSGLLLLSNAIWWFSWRESNEQLSSLLQQALQVSEKQDITVSDTIYRTVVVHQYDTIYRTVVVRSVLEKGIATTSDEQLTKNQKTDQNAFFRSGAPDEGNSGTGKTITTSDTPGKQSAPTTNSGKAAPSDVAVAGTSAPATSTQPFVPPTGEGVEIAENSEAVISLEEIAQIRAAETTVNPLPLRYVKEIRRRPHPPIPLPPLADWETVTPEQKKPFPLIPKTFHLGIGGGWALPGASVIASKSGQVAAVAGEIGFSDQLSLVVEGAYNSLEFQGYVYDQSIGLPTPNPPGDDYDSKYFETHDAPKPMFQLTTAMRYRFSADKKLSPFLGAGFATQWHPEYELEYEYTHRPSGTEFSETVEVEDLDKPLSFLHFEFGLTYNLSKRWELQAVGFYNTEASRSQLGIPRYYGLKTFLVYSF